MILLLSTSDTDLLSARASGAEYRLGNPARLTTDDLPELIQDVSLVLVRILGGRRMWEEGLDWLLACGLPVVVLGGEQQPDAALMELSTVPGGVCAEAHLYLAHGGPANLTELHKFLSDTVLLTGHGFEAPAATPTWGVLEREGTPEGPTVAVLYYRAHHVAGNTAFVHALCDAIEAKGGKPLPVFCSSLRTAEPELLDTLRQADALVVTVLAAGGTNPAKASAGGDDDAWDVGAQAALDVPILQGLCLTSSRESWDENDDGLSPLDTATQVAIPEFDGRIITVPFSFKEIDSDGLTVYVADPERALRVAGIAVRHGRLRHIPVAERKIAVMLSAYPTKHSRIGNAVGLDTPHVDRAVAEGHAGARLRHRRRAAGCAGAGRRRADPRVDRGRWSGRGLADAGAVREQPRAHRGRGLPGVLRDASRGLPRVDAGALGRGPWHALRGPQQVQGRRDRAGRVAVQQRRRDRAAAARVRREPDRDLPRPGPAAVAPLPRGVPVDRVELRRGRGRARRQARQPGVVARQDRRHVGILWHGRGARRSAAGLPVPRQRPR